MRIVVLQDGSKVAVKEVGGVSVGFDAEVESIDATTETVGGILKEPSKTKTRKLLDQAYIKSKGERNERIQPRPKNSNS